MAKVSSIPVFKNSDISVGLCVFSYESDDARVIIRDFSFPSHVHIFECNQKGNSFPINSLRNLAIQNTNSSHLYIADVDIIPASFFFIWFYDY